MNEKNLILRQLPQINAFLEENRELVAVYGREQVAEALRKSLSEIRQKLIAETGTQPQDWFNQEQLLRLVEQRLMTEGFSGLSKVINGTGVLLHTNLGRAVLGERAVSKLVQVASSYSNLELSLDSGRRGERYVYAETVLKQLTGAEGALVVNNNAAAVVLMLNSIAKDKEVIVSRGQLVEVGGGFRIPEIMAFSGARIREVGTTNRTYLKDYEGAITSETGAFLYVHPSNYRVEGFCRQVEIGELAELAQRTGIPFLVDAGSGLLFKEENPFLSSELVLDRLIVEGADLVSFSGDKLLGGPQAGIIIGKKSYINKLKNNQFLRALRVDKLTLAALEETLKIYLYPRQVKEQIPFWRALTMSEEELETRSDFFFKELFAKDQEGRLEAETISGYSLPGGGALPGVKIPTRLIRIRAMGCSSSRLAELLRQGRPPVIVRTEDQWITVDLRTLVDDKEISELVDCLLSVILGRRDRE